jgi:hypothetical protein
MQFGVKWYVQRKKRHDVLAVLERDAALFRAFQQPPSSRADSKATIATARSAGHEFCHRAKLLSLQVFISIKEKRA